MINIWFGTLSKKHQVSKPLLIVFCDINATITTILQIVTLNFSSHTIYLVYLFFIDNISHVESRIQLCPYTDKTNRQGS